MNEERPKTFYALHIYRYFCENMNNDTASKTLNMRHNLVQSKYNFLLVVVGATSSTSLKAISANEQRGNN